MPHTKDEVITSMQRMIRVMNLFTSYASALDQIVVNLTLNRFADDHSIRKEFKPSSLEKDETKIIKIMEYSMLAVKD